jgi:hypothetical protein
MMAELLREFNNLLGRWELGREDNSRERGKEF